jgi:hypothetical protein
MNEIQLSTGGLINGRENGKCPRRSLASVPLPTRVVKQNNILAENWAAVVFSITYLLIFSMEQSP